MNGLKLKSTPTSGENYVEILRKISVPSDFLLFCKFKGKLEVDCLKFFKETITDDGICYTFNMLKPNELFKNDDEEIEESTWSVTSGYDNKNSDVYPHRAVSGADVGFNIVLNMKTSDIDFLCRGPVQGYKMKIHSPDEFPRMYSGYQRIPFNSEVIAHVKPELKLNSQKEFCHSTSSKSLRYFKQYSQANCLAECLSTHVESECGCIKFSMVHNNRTKICDQHHTQCITQATDSFSIGKVFETDFPCDCKPSCDQLKFDTKVSQAVFDFKKVFTAFEQNLEEEFPSSIMSRLVVYLDGDYFVPTSYESKDTTLDTIAKIGGTLALFLGASLISIVEILFYIGRRLTS